MEPKFINTLPYISNPVDEFSDFVFVSREGRIYPRLVGAISQEEVGFFGDLIMKKGLKSVLDLGVGGGKYLSSIITYLEEKKYTLANVEANEIEMSFVMQAEEEFRRHDQDVLIHKGNWLDLPKASPPYEHKFDFAYLIGNSLTYIGGGSREYTKRAQESVVNKFAEMIEPGGYLFVDTRDYDYINSLMTLSPREIMEAYQFTSPAHYHGAGKDILVFPAYISDTVVVLHYYDKENHRWSKLDLYPVYHTDIINTLSKEFIIEKVYYDYQETPKDKCVLRQYLARKK